MRRLVLLMLLALSRPGWAGLEFDHRLEVLNSYSRWRLADGPWKRGLQERRWEQEWRLDLDWEGDAARLWLKPRLTWANAAPRRDLWLNEGGARWRGERISIQAGREILLWGPSLFWSPSNPFYRRNGRDLPQRELAGHDIARLDGEAGEVWRWQLARQFGDGHGDEAGEDSIWSARLERLGGRSTLALVVSRADHDRPRLGGYGQFTASEGLILYGDAVLAARGTLIAPEPGPAGWTLRTASDRRYRPTAVLGGAYTWSNGLTLYAEGLYAGLGLDRGETERRAAAARDLARTGGPEAGRVGELLDSGSVAYRRRYLAFHLTESGAEDYGWALRGIGNLDDGSGELVLQLSRDLGGHVRFWGNLLGRWGGREDEYRRLARAGVWAGVSLFW